LGEAAQAGPGVEHQRGLRGTVGRDRHAGRVAAVPYELWTGCRRRTPNAEQTHVHAAESSPAQPRASAASASLRHVRARTEPRRRAVADSKDISGMLAQVDLFRGLQPKMLRRIADSGKLVDFAPGHEVTTSGSTGVA